MRKVIQIATTSSEETEKFHVDRSIVALCDDGTVWRLAAAYHQNFSDRRWVKMPNIPQPTAHEYLEGLENGN